MLEILLTYMTTHTCTVQVLVGDPHSQHSHTHVNDQPFTFSHLMKRIQHTEASRVNSRDGSGVLRLTNVFFWSASSFCGLPVKNHHHSTSITAHRNLNMCYIHVYLCFDNCLLLNVFYEKNVHVLGQLQKCSNHENFQILHYVAT